jgi:hypothetical protein
MLPAKAGVTETKTDRPKKGITREALMRRVLSAAEARLSVGGASRKLYPLAGSFLSKRRF